MSGSADDGTPAFTKSTEEVARRLRSRNRALLAVLLGLVILMYFVAVVRMRGG